ncbi:DUF4926 domain-containing protein [Devosia sp.]|uniref:DUF4926 domain-containing protein n=1 Tax=Devosia sp. TaxID=1871048 RepID=UPI003F6E5E76
MTDLREYDVVVVTHSRHPHLREGMIGTIVLVLDAAAKVFEVEFLDERKTSLGTFTIAGADLAPWRAP